MSIERVIERYLKSPDGRLLIAMSPDMKPIYEVGEMPEWWSPREVWIRPSLIYIDGWVFSLKYLSGRGLKWLTRYFGQCAEEDKSPENREWLAGILHLIRKAIEGGGRES